MEDIKAERAQWLARVYSHDPVAISEEVFRRNAHFLDGSKDYWLAQRIKQDAALAERLWEESERIVAALQSLRSA